MGLSLKVLGGTPRHGDSLCFSCQQAHVIQGQAVSDLTVFCNNYFDKPMRIQRPVAECTEFQRKNSQDRNEMERIAWILETKKGKFEGFYQPAVHKHRAKTEEIDDPED